MLRAPSDLHMLLSNSCCKSGTIYKCWVQNGASTVQCSLQISATTRCKHHAIMCNAQMITQHVANTVPLAALSFRKKRKRCQFQKAANAMRFANDSYKALQAPCVALSFTQYAVHTVQVIVFGFGMLQAFYSVRFFFASDR